MKHKNYNVKHGHIIIALAKIQWKCDYNSNTIHYEVLK